ncbi:hypothetical protein M9434_004564 [Picochlorum sp. BPE23]|nr:hypothetical protein M9435_002655 [Picochlorum sp. BPE23]KAI8110990.1 hypothetical protein M9434_004564 [Picochlorum sp. BPE23]
MSGLFETYETSYCDVSTNVASSLGNLGQVPLEQRGVKARQLERQLKEAEQTLQRLDMEARSAPAPESSELVKKVKGYRKDWQKLMGDVRRVIQQAASAEDRAELGLADEYYQTSAGQRERLLTSTEQLNKTSEKIHEGRRQLLETEEVGAGIVADLHRQRQSLEESRRRVDDELGVSVLSDLQRQRESIMHSRETLSHVDANVGKARQVLAVMSRRITQNKFIMYGIIALLVGAIGLLIWAKLT